MTETDLPKLIITIVLVFTILFMGTAVANQVLNTTANNDAVTNQPVLLNAEPGTNTWHTLADTVGRNPDVVDSTGIAVNLRGTDSSYVQSEDDINISGDDTWTVSLWASADNGTANMPAISVDGRLVITYNGSTSEWRAWYYDDGSTSSYNVSVAAPNQPDTLVNVQVVRNGTDLTIYRNNTAGTTANLSNTSSEPAPVATDSWDGRLDELRGFDTALNTSQRQSLVDSPVAPLPSADRTLRVMFDERGASTQLLFYASGGITVNDAGYGTGVPGNQMQQKSVTNDLAGTTDYRWRVTGPQIKAVDSGELDAAPVAYASYDRQGPLDSLANDWNTAMALAGVLLLLLPLGAIVVYIRGARGR